MAKWSENLEQYAIEVIMGREKGFQAACLRALLYCLSLLYGLIVRTRLWLYRKRFLQDRPLGCMVISIGNLTVGGTGKTPVVEKFARSLQDSGRRVAVLSRGYKSKRRVKPSIWKRLSYALTGRRMPEDPPRIVADGNDILLDSYTAGDEPYMLARNLKDVAVIVDKDRVKSGLHAVRDMKIDTLILDDGLQYLRLGHRLDIVLVDCQSPFGNEYLLPRGTLREPPVNIRRASYIFLTKSDGSGQAELVERIRKYNRTAEIIECRHKPLYFENLMTGEQQPLDFISGQYVGAICGIAQPQSFYDGLKRLGANLEVVRSFTDHHRFSEKEITQFLERCVRRDLSAAVTTQKDAVRFPKFPSLPVPVYFMRVEIEILSGQETWEHCVKRICQPPPNVVPYTRFFS